MKYFWITFLFWSCLHCAATNGAPLTLQVIGRSHLEAADLKLSQADQQWLQQRKVLRIGVSNPDYPPFDITNHPHEYEGITADYAALLGDLLNIPVQILRYDDRAQLIQALKDQTIDLIGTANDYEAVLPDLVLSTPYTLDQPTIVARADDELLLDPTLAGKKVAMVYHYLSLDAVRQFYPNAEFILFPSILNAIGAVALGDADLYLGDSISSSYLINKSYLNNVQLINFSTMEVNNYSFALLRNNTRLQALVNKALDSIPASERMAIAHRWGAGGVSISGSHQIQFSVDEQRWLQQHRRLKVLFNENFLPFTYADEQGNFKGLSADVLAKISLRTGLRFEAHQGSSVNDMIADLKAGKYDLMPALSPSLQRENDVSFTRPYLSPPLVMVTSTDSYAPRGLAQMSGKKLAVIEGSAQIEQIARDHGQIQLVQAGNYNDAFQLVANGKADAIISSLITARYIIARAHPERLKVAATIGTQGNPIAFAVNRSAPELLSILNKSLLSISPEEMDEVSNRWRRAVVLEDSYWARHRDTIIQSLAAMALLILGGFAWITLLRREVARRKQAERALNDKLEFERVLINGTPHPIYARDRDAKLLLCNEAYLKTFAVTDGRYLLGTTVVQSLLSERIQAEEYHQDYLDVMASGEPVFKDRLLVSSSGEVLTIYHWMLPYRGSDGTVKGLIGGWIDISERHHLIQQLHAAKTEADDANRAKSTFLATMSHEIRTPMNAVIGMLEMASKTAEQGVYDQIAIEVASEAAKGLLDLIGDILDIARIESGQLSLSPERCNPRDLVLSVVRIFDGPAKQKSLHLLVSIEPQVNCDVLIDPMRFKQVLANLLSNAIKFTVQGAIEISVSAPEHQGSNPLQLVLQIRDSGIGISAADQQRLFTPFTQANSSNQTATKGSGLGLVISRTLVEMMGGTLVLESVESEGTLITITLVLPVLESHDPTTAVPEKPPSHAQPGACRLNILIVDDYAANRIVLSRQLGYLGHEVHEAVDGNQALALWGEQPFDVIITDCNMPDMDGYQLARAIRAQEALRAEPSCLVLGFTANAVPEERQRCLEAGMDDCLFKPISLEQLSARLLELYAASVDAQPDEEFSSDQLQARLRDLSVGDAGVMDRLRSELVSSHTQGLIDLQRLMMGGDRQGLTNLAHQIKGAARLLQFEELVVTCENLEDTCQRQASPPDVEAAASAVRARVQQLLQCLHDPSGPA